MRSPALQIFTSLMLVLLTGQGVRGHQSSADLVTMSLEELMDVEVSLTSRTRTPLFETASAVFILTADDIRRSGATSLPDVLRLVPGMQVARVDASKWAVSARGFAHRFANKLLVLVDGRHVYSPLFAGVFWETIDVAMADIERIEVVRGPGATLWGANAVNGIVHIITRSAADTRGAYAAHTQALTEASQSSELRYGGPLAGGGSFRLYGRHLDHDRSATDTGTDAMDAWQGVNGGFRADWQRPHHNLSVQGGVYADDIEQNPPERFMLPDGIQDASHSGGHLLGNWQHALSTRSNLEVTGSYELYDREDGINDVRSQAWEIDFQHQFLVRPQRELIWGISYRSTSNERLGSFEFPFDPLGFDSDVFSAFAHGEATLDEGRLRLALGTKFEHNQFTDVELQPSARVIWTPDERQVLWVSLTRAVRTPALSDFRFIPDSLHARPPTASGEAPVFGPPPPGLVSMNNVDFQSESVRAVEAGYRLHPARDVLIDLAAYYNDYADLRLITLLPPPVPGAPPDGAGGPPVAGPPTGGPPLGGPPGGPPGSPLGGLAGQPPGGLRGPPAGIDDIEPVNGVTMGGELSADVLFRHGRLRASTSIVHFDLPEGAPRPAGTVSEQRVTLWPSLNVGHRVQVDAILQFVNPYDQPQVPEEAGEFVSQLSGYTELDLRLNLRLTRHWRLTLAGKNLLHDEHAEFTGFVLDSQPTRMRRVVYGALRWSL